MTAQYTAVATSSGGREGYVRSSDGVLDLALARAAHEEICPYSRAVRGNVAVEVRVE